MKIKGNKYAIKFRPMRWKGMSEFPERCITIRPGMDRVTEAKTVLHELLHGIVYEYSPVSYTDEEEHRLIYPIERGIAELAKENPHDWLVLAVTLSRLSLLDVLKLIVSMICKTQSGSGKGARSPGRKARRKK